MSTTVEYMATTIATVDNDTVILETAGTYMQDDIMLIDVTGGGGITIAEMVSGSKPTGEIDITGLTISREYALAQFPNITRIVGEISILDKQKAFQGNTGLLSANIKITTGASTSDFFANCTNMVTSVVKISGYNNATGINNSCTKLEIADYDVPRIRTNTFYNNTKLATLILRSSTITGLENTGAIATGTYFKSGGAGGDIYIPKTLYDHLGDNSSSDYKAASNWSTVDGYGTITWHAIEGSYYETHYADGTVIS